MNRTILIYRAIPGSSIADSEFDLIQDLANQSFSFLVIDTEGIDNRNGWFFAEPISDTKQKVYRSLPVSASINEVLDLLKSITSNGLDPNNIPKPGSHPGKPEDVLIDLEGSGGAYRGLFPIFTIAGAPAWLVDLLNTLTGHGKLAFYLWLIASGLIGTKVATDKKKSILYWGLLLFAVKMTYDSYKYKQQASKQKFVSP